MDEQLNLFKGRQLMLEGIETAAENADKNCANWSQIAFEFLMKYANEHDIFKTEDVRAASINKIPQPHSNLAWGGVTLRAKKAGLIKKVGVMPARNPKSHCTPSNVWTLVRKY